MTLSCSTSQRWLTLIHCMTRPAPSPTATRYQYSRASTRCRSRWWRSTASRRRSGSSLPPTCANSRATQCSWVASRTRYSYSRLSSSLLDPLHSTHRVDSVPLQSKRAWLGPNYINEGLAGNDISRTNGITMNTCTRSYGSWSIHNVYIVYRKFTHSLFYLQCLIFASHTARRPSSRSCRWCCRLRAKITRPAGRAKVYLLPPHRSKPNQPLLQLSFAIGCLHIQ